MGDARFPLAMWLCAACGLAQLERDDSLGEESGGIEPAALRDQATQALRLVRASPFWRGGAIVHEFPSPPGASWVDGQPAEGLRPAAPDEPADLVLDSFGLMHEKDQAAAIRSRAERLGKGGTLLIQFHSLTAVLAGRQWNVLRHGHFAYYSLTALAAMLDGVGLRARTAWLFDLYGGTVLLAATAVGDADASISEILRAEDAAGVRTAAAVTVLQRCADLDAEGLRVRLRAARRDGIRVLGYGAASRAVALLSLAGIDRTLLDGVADLSPAKQGCRMPGTDIPVISPAELIAAAPDEVLLLLPDLLPEVSAAYPGLAGRWRVHTTPDPDPPTGDARSTR